MPGSGEAPPVTETTEIGAQVKRTPVLRTEGVLLDDLRSHGEFSGLGDDALAEVAHRAAEEAVIRVLGSLRHIPLFADVADEDLLRLAPHVEVIELQPGDILARAGDPRVECLVLQRGELVYDPGAGRDVPQGAVIGLDELFEDGTWDVSCSAVEASTLVALEGRGFRSALGGDAMTLRMLRSAARESPGPGAMETSPSSIPPVREQLDADEPPSRSAPSRDEEHFVSESPTSERLGSVDLGSLIQRVADESGDDV